MHVLEISKGKPIHFKYSLLSVQCKAFHIPPHTIQMGRCSDPMLEIYNLIYGKSY